MPSEPRSRYRPGPVGRLARAMIAVVLLLACAHARAQGLERPPVVLRIAPSLASLADPLAVGVARRSERGVIVGAALDAELATLEEAPDLGPAVVGVAHHGDRVALFATATSGRRHVSELGAASDDVATTRVLVVALSMFLEDLDADVAPPPPPPPQVVDSELAPTDNTALADLASPYREQRFDLGFVVELRERIGYATQRDQGVPATGGSGGACFGTWWCLVADIDVMAPFEVHALNMGTLTYSSVTTGIGGRFLPLEAGPLRGGVGIDALLRISELQTHAPEFPDYSTITYAAGMRLLAELGVQLAGPLSLVIEGGADIGFSAVRFVRAGNAVFNEDVMLLWAALGLRVGPF